MLKTGTIYGINGPVIYLKGKWARSSRWTRI